MNDENMKLIMAEFAKINKRLDGIETRLDGIETRLDRIETRLEKLETRVGNLETRLEKLETRVGNLEAENVETNKRLGMIELKLDNIQDNYEKLERDFFGLVGEAKAGFYKVKHQLRALEGQGETIVKTLEFRGLLLGMEKI